MRYCLIKSGVQPSPKLLERYGERKAYSLRNCQRTVGSTPIDHFPAEKMTKIKPVSPISREDLKRNHQKQILLLARGGNKPCAEFAGISRAEITTHLGLSFPSVTALVDELLDKGILEETGELESNDRGRPRKLLRASPSLFYVPAFELITEGFHFCVYDVYGTVVHRAFFPLPRQKNRDRTLWKPTVDEFCAPFLRGIAALNGRFPLLDILLSIPGNLREDGAFTSSSVGVISPPGFLQYVKEHTGLNVRTINRSDSFAYAEQIYNPTLSDYVYVHISDGVGAGIIRERRIFSCEPWRAGEIGHMSVNYKGRACSCGSRGCLERYLSKSAIVEDCARYFDGAVVDFDTVCQAYLDSVEHVEAFMESRAELLAVAMNNMFAMHPVTHVIIGGAITRFGDRFLACLERKMYANISRMYKGKSVLTFSRREGNDSTFGAYHNYVTNILKIEDLL